MSINLSTMFEAVAATVPDRPALSCGDVTLTFAQLQERVNRLSQHLTAQGFETNQHVGLLMQNRVEYVDGMLASLRARLVPINLNYRYTATELSYVIKDAELRAVVVEGEFAAQLNEVLPDCPTVRHVIVIDDGTPALDSWHDTVTVTGYDQVLADNPATPPDVVPDPDDRFVLYTGGTTGYPKGVVWRHEDFWFAALFGGNPYGDPYHSIDEMVGAIQNGPALTYLICAPLMHGAASYSLFMALFNGSHIVILPRFEVLDILRTVERHKVQIVQIVGDAMARPIADALREHGSEFDLSSLFVLGSGGALLSQSVSAELQALLPNSMILNNFGSSESGSDGSMTLDKEGHMVLQPKPAVRIVDEDRVTIEPSSDKEGYLARSGHVPLCYYNDPEKSAKTFPVIDGVRWVVPGDRARWSPDGTTIVVLGRGSNMINSGGEKIFPEEVEQALKSHPDVLDALVAGVPDDRYGQRVAAVVQIKDGHEAPDVESIRTHVRSQLAGYKVPARVEIVEQVRRSPAGKADYRWVKATLGVD